MHRLSEVPFICSLLCLCSGLGETSERMEIGTRGNIHSIRFLDERTGLAVGDSASIFKTADGGASWRRVAHGLMPFPLYCAYLLDDSTYLAAGENGEIMRSTDGGESWSDNRSEVGRSTRLSFCFPEPGLGYLAGVNSTVLKTEDGGKTWKQLRTPGESVLYGCAFLNRDTGYVVGSEGSSGGIIYKTEDGGLHWTWQAQGEIEKLLLSVAILAGDSVYAVGTQGAVATTVDGGKEWTYYHTVDPVTLHDLACPAPAQCHAVGNYGAVQLSGKRVRPWHFGTDATLRSIACPSERVCYAAGDSGIAFRFDPTATAGISRRIAGKPGAPRREPRGNAPVFLYRERDRRADGRALPSVRPAFMGSPPAPAARIASGPEAPIPPR